MKILLFPTSTGQGHNNAAAAIKEYLDTQKIDARILDVLDSGRKKSKFISKLYDGMVNYVPWFFGALYSLGERVSSSKRHSPIYYLNTLYSRSLYNIINDMQPDVIVCPHMFGAHAITRLIEKYNMKIPTVGIITDYTCSPFWEETLLDSYVVPHQVVAEECISKGMDKNKIFVIGIPVKDKFSKKTKKEEARAVFGIEKEKVFAIMGGSMGYGKIPQLAEELSQRVPDAQVVAVCGSNKNIYKKTKEKKGVIALGFIDNVDVLMDAADVLLTKPGGLSATETMTKRLPLIITMPIPGGEERNSAVLAGMGVAVYAETVKDAADAACRLIENSEARAKMVELQEAHFRLDATKDIGNLIIKMARKE